jgi:predicted negative regulator of RcsB-dependent stress response
MATYDLEEQEQLEELKAWWKLYGNLITWVLLALALSVAGWQGWNWYQRQQSTQASALFNVLQRAAAERDMQKLKSATGELLEKFGGSTYAPMAALLAGKTAFDAGDLKTAKVQLSWAVDHSADEMKDLARLRLAAVLLDEKAFDEALKVVEQAGSRNFEPLFAESRGDILLAQGKRSEAKAAYQAALQKKADAIAGQSEGRSTGFREVLQQKLDTLGDV